MKILDQASDCVFDTHDSLVRLSVLLRKYKEQYPDARPSDNRRVLQMLSDINEILGSKPYKAITTNMVGVLKGTLYRKP